MAASIDLYFFGTPNGQKIPIMLEECELPYRVHRIDITKGDQRSPAFLQISPNGKIPAISDPAGPGGAPITVFESGAILQYLARKTGRFYPASERDRVQVDEWLFWQVGGVGPMGAQAHHFLKYATEKVPYAMERYKNEMHRLYGVMNTRLENRDYLAGDYSIADIACFPWTERWRDQGIDMTEFPHLETWMSRIRARPAVQRAREKTA